MKINDIPSVERLLKEVLKTESVTLTSTPKGDLRVHLEYVLPFEKRQAMQMQENQQHAFFSWLKDVVMPIGELMGIGKEPLEKRIQQLEAERDENKIKYNKLFSDFEVYKSAIKDAR